MTKAITATPREAQAFARNIVRNHNAACENPIRTRVSKGTLQFALVGKGEEWFTATGILDIISFANGVSDVEQWGSNLPEREFGTHSEEAAYFFGTLRAQACGAGREADLCASASPSGAY